MTGDRAQGVSVADVVTVLDESYPRALAQSWDSVGLVCGDPDDDVRRVLVCVDVTDDVVDVAVRQGAGLVLAHHPLLLRGVDSVAADTPKGRIVHRLIRNRIALLTAHTNADSAPVRASRTRWPIFSACSTPPRSSPYPLRRWTNGW